LHEKIRHTKATLYQVNEQTKAYTEIIESRKINETSSDINISENTFNKGSATSKNQFIEQKLNNSIDLINYGIDTLTNKISQKDLVANNYVEEQKQKDRLQFNSTNTEQLKNDLDEVELITSRVRDSISIDLSNTRRYSPLLYEFYRKQLELAKSIQSTYNIQCNNLFDAMTLMKTCLKDYCQTVHNPG
jgi:hypothetical protein